MAGDFSWIGSTNLDDTPRTPEEAYAMEKERAYTWLVKESGILGNNPAISPGAVMDMGPEEFLILIKMASRGIVPQKPATTQSPDRTTQAWSDLKATEV